MFFCGKYYHFQWKWSNLCLELRVVQSNGCLTKSNDIVSANLIRLPCYVSTLRLPCYVSTAISQLCTTEPYIFINSAKQRIEPINIQSHVAVFNWLFRPCLFGCRGFVKFIFFNIWSWGLLSLRIKELNDIHGMLDNSQRGSKAWIENGRNVSSHRQCFKIGQHLKYRKRKVSNHSNVFT